MLSEEKLRKVLEELGLVDAQIEVEGAVGHLVAAVVSPGFKDIDEAKRQEQVWRHLRDNLNDAERSDIEFVFTSTPEENTELAESAS